jgi:glycosyltransferase involved in cell wall biosynthesis
MNIIHIIPGSGGSFYCGNCLRDSKYVDALRIRGHKVVKIPMYLPLFSDEHDLADIPVFYGAISIYLKQLYPVFRKAPAWFDKFLNSKLMLKLAAGMAGSTRAKGLEEMTVSMLMGEEGQQAEELERMVDWMAEHCNPDVIHISNALLLGLAAKIRQKIRVPVFCSLQDEDVWVDVMQPAFRDKVWQLMSDKSKDVDVFISVSHYYAGVMQQHLKIPHEKLHTIHLGVDQEAYTYMERKGRPVSIGYISRMCHENGLDILVDAFILLRKNDNPELKLVITGGSTGDDVEFLKTIRKKLKENQLQDEVEFHEDFEGDGRQAFFDKVSMLSVPVRNGEAFGMYLLEAMSCGVPVVQPALGAFPEIIELSEGGVTYESNEPAALAAALQHLIDDPNHLEELSRNALKGVKEKFNIYKHTDEMVDVYQSAIDKKKTSHA